MTHLIKRLFCLFAVLILFNSLSAETHAAGKEMSATAIYNALTQNPDWLNTSRPLTPDDLKGRVILIDFWTYCCINCIHVVPKLQELEHQFGDKLTVIGIHSAKFATEGETKNIREAVQKYGIEHPVVNDADFRIWNSFGANSWPTIALIGADGLLKNVYRGEGDIEEMRSDIQRQIKLSGDKLVTAALPLSLEKNKIPPTILRFPTKLTAKDETTLVISDSGHQRILLVDLKTNKIIQTIGSGVKGFQDGDLSTAQFRDPQGVLTDGNLIFVADTGNHRLRQIDLDKKQVTTIAGMGERGTYSMSGSSDAMDTALASPWDLAFYPDKNTIVIANAGTHQLWAYDREEKTVHIIAGNGQESIDDGHLPYNSLSQPSGLSVYDDQLYFVDSETSSLRVYDGSSVETLIGTGLFDFGLKDGTKSAALMQHPIGLFAGEEGVVVADTYNHKMRLYQDDELSTLPIDGLDEPNGVTEINHVFYIADTNHHRIVKMDAKGKQSGMLDIMPMEQLVMYQDRVPNILPLSKAMIGPKASVQFDLPKGWHINPDAPSYLSVFDTSKTSVQDFKSADVKAQKITISDLNPADYILQGIVYYCEDKAGSQCLIRGINMELNLSQQGDETISIPLPKPTVAK